MAITVQNINLQPEIEEWRDAYCGKDVRQANIDAFEKIQSSVNGAIQDIVQVTNNVVNKANETIDASNTTLGKANAAIEQANETLEEAEQVKQDAEQSALEASGSAASALTSKNDAENAAELASQYAQIVAPNFFLDIDSGILYQKAGVGVDFKLDESTGYLYWAIATA